MNGLPAARKDSNLSNQTVAPAMLPVHPLVGFAEPILPPCRGGYRVRLTDLEPRPPGIAAFVPRWQRAGRFLREPSAITCTSLWLEPSPYVG